jgi:hypothetical protein
MFPDSVGRPKLYTPSDPNHVSQLYYSTQMDMLFLV